MYFSYDKIPEFETTYGHIGRKLSVFLFFYNILYISHVKYDPPTLIAIVSCDDTRLSFLALKWFSLLNADSSC